MQLITLQDWTNAGLSYHKYEYLRKKGRLNTFPSRACRNQPVSIILDSIRDIQVVQTLEKKLELNNKNVIEEGDGYLFHKEIPILEEAREYYYNYRLDSGKLLPKKVQNEYTILASIYSLIGKISNDNKEAIANLGGSRNGFWKKALEMSVILSKKLEFDLKIKSHKVFKRNVERFQKEGFESVISGKWGNSNGFKITKEIEDWFVVQLASTRLSVHSVYIMYIKECDIREWPKSITYKAFEKRMAMEKNRLKIQLMRHGQKQLRNKKGFTHSIEKPTYSNDLWVSDGTSFNLYYNNNGKPAMATTYFVMDAKSRMFLGWSTKEGINKENQVMQREAYRMALRNAGTKPHQIKYDNQGGHKGQTSNDFYNKLAKVHFASKAYRPTGKSIERCFAAFQSQKIAELPFWTGFNRKSHAKLDYAPNMEDISKNLDKLPTYKELLQLIDVLIEEWNTTDYSKDKKGTPKEIYNRSKREDQKNISIDELSELFWEVKGPVTYQPHGITLRHDGQELLYEVYDDNGNIDFDFRLNYLKNKMYIKYDPEFEYTLVDLLVMHPTQGLQKIATASPKKKVSESVRDIMPGQNKWLKDQIKAEEELYEKVGVEMKQMGYDENTKWSDSWRNKLNPVQSKKTSLYITHDDDDETELTIIK